MRKVLCVIILFIILPVSSKTFTLKKSEIYNGVSDMWVYRKETEVITSSTNTFSELFEASTGLEDTLLLLNDIYRQS